MKKIKASNTSRGRDIDIDYDVSSATTTTTKTTQAVTLADDGVMFRLRRRADGDFALQSAEVGVRVSISYLRNVKAKDI